MFLKLISKPTTYNPIILDGQTDLILTKEENTLTLDNEDKIPVKFQYLHFISIKSDGKWNATKAALKYIWRK